MNDKPNIAARMSLFDGVKESCWFYRWFQFHSFILIIKTLFRPITKEDLINGWDAYWPEPNYIKYGRIKSMHPHYTAAKIIQSMLKEGMITACVLAIIDAGLGFAGPIILKYILMYLNSPQDKLEEKNVAWALSALWIGLYFMKIFVSQYWQRICAGSGVIAEVTLESQLYRKLMRVSMVYRKYISMGDFYGYLIVDISVITNMINQFANLFGAPTTLLLSIIFVCEEIGPYGLILLAVIALAIFIELSIDFMRADVYAQKLVKFEGRIADNMHLYNEFKNLKNLGWERMIVNHNIRNRVAETKLNQIYYTLGQIYIFITRLAPYVVIFILFMIGFLNKQEEQWNSTVVYTVIGYIGVTFGPLTVLPNVIVSIFQAMKAFGRIDNFLEADEIERIKNIYMPEGSVEMSRLVISTGTRKSIDRLILRESLYIGQHNHLVMHVKNLPIEVRAHQTLDDINEEDIERFRKSLMCLTIPFHLAYGKGERVAVLSRKSGSGKTSLLKAFLGLFSIESGYMKYAGKLGFASATGDFYLNQSIKDNVVFGEEFDDIKLERAYRLSGLDTELQKFTDYDNTLLDETDGVLAPAQKCLISLARAIYYDCDILLLDDFFQLFDIDESIEIYNRMCINLTDKLLILTSNTIHFLRPNDRIIIVEDSYVVEEGTLAELKSRTNSHIRNYHIKSPYLLKCMETIEQNKEELNEINISIIRSLLPRKETMIEEPMYYEPNTMMMDYFPQHATAQSFFSNGGDCFEEKLEPPIQKHKEPSQRFTLIELRYYWAFLSTGGCTILLVFLTVTIACSSQTFATWIIGSVSNIPFGLSVGTLIVIYASLQIGYAVVLLISGVIMPGAAHGNTQRLINYFNNVIMRMKLTELQRMSKMLLTFVVGYDYLNFFTMSDEAITIFSSFVSLVSTVVIMGLASSYIWIIGVAVLFYCGVIYLIFRRSQREIFNVCGVIRAHFFRTFENAVEGSDVIQYYDKVQWFRTKIFDAIYMFSVLWKNNARWSLHGLNILIGLGELVLIAGIVFIAVNNKGRFTKEEVIFVGVALSGAPALMGIIVTLLNTLSDLANNINLLLKVPAEFFRHKEQPTYDEPLPPTGWPWTGKIELKNVTVAKPQMKEPLLKSLDLVIPSGQIVGMYGDYDSDIFSLFLILNRLKVPSFANGDPAGTVKISDINTRDIGQIYTTQNVVLLDSQPAAFTGTLRFNVDPFEQYADEQIEKAVKTVSFWDDLDSDFRNPRMMEGYGTLNFVIEERGKQLKSASLQKINIIRAILKKPKVLLMQYGLVKVGVEKNEAYHSLVTSLFKETTIVILTGFLHNLFNCDRVIGLKGGKIVEDGPPHVIAANPSSRLYKMLMLLGNSPSYDPQSENMEIHTTESFIQE